MQFGKLSLSALALLVAGSALGAGVKGSIKIDGSSTVFPITEAIAEEFQKANKDAKVTVGVSGTGGGFKKFAAGEIDINNASRPIKDEELKKAAESKVEAIELPIAFDGLSIVVNPKNDWAKQITMAQLKKLWEPGSTVKTWKDLDPAWPDKPVKLFGPGADSGTFDYFTEHVMGKSKASRTDYTSSEDDNVIVNGVAGDVNAVGYFGYAYYVENKSKIKALPVDGGNGAVAPDDKSIESGSYPLSRPVFIVVSKKSAERPEVDAFVRYYIANAKTASKEVGYTPLPQATYDAVLKRYEAKQTGNWKSSH